MDMTRAVIFCKTFDLNIDSITTLLGMFENNIYIAADSGLETAEKFNIVPNVIIGDFDSVDSELLTCYKNIIKYPAEKDDTDSMLCVKYALGLGYQSILIIGGIGGRIDHTLANLSLLKYIHKHGARGIITDGFNRIFYLKNGGMTVCRNSKYISIIPISEELRGVTLKGFKYTLENAVVKFDEPYTISNEIPGNESCEIIITDGEAYICECD